MSVQQRIKHTQVMLGEIIIGESISNNEELKMRLHIFHA